MRDRLLIGLGMVATLVVTGATAFDMERVQATGDTVLLELAPVDPRSLIQGDYMRLRYAAGDVASAAAVDIPNRGDVILALDDREVGTFARFDGGESLGEREHRFDYHLRDGRVDIGTGSWMFQEGTAEVWNEARYGEFRVLPSGRAVLVGLRDAELGALGEPLRTW